MTMAHHPLSLITFLLQFSNIIYTPKNTVNTFSSQPSCAHNKWFIYTLPTWPFTVMVFIQQSRTTNTRRSEEMLSCIRYPRKFQVGTGFPLFQVLPDYSLNSSLYPSKHCHYNFTNNTFTLLSSKLQHFYTPSSPSILLLLRLLLISSPTYHHFTRLTKTYHMQFPSLPQALVLSITHIRHLVNLP